MNKLKETVQLPVKAIEIKELIRKDSARYPGGQCKNCRSKSFQKHVQRDRWFVVVLAYLAYNIKSALYRWRCSQCGVTFTNYGKFCLPFKRHLRPEIESRSLGYIEGERTSYCAAAGHKGVEVFYAGPTAGTDSSEEEKEREQSRSLAPSSVHRWISGIAARRSKFQSAIQTALRQGMKPEELLVFIPAWKYRSAARKRILQACGQMLRAMKFFACRNPTEFATLGSSP